MLILVFLKMMAETAFYCTFAGLLGQIFDVDRGTVVLAVPVFALSFMLSYLLRNRKALRFLPLLLIGVIGFLPGRSIPLGILLLPPAIYMIVLAAKKRYEPDHGSAVSILSLYWKLAIVAIIIAALIEYGKTGVDPWGEILWESGENRMLSEETLPLVLMTLISLVLLTRTLRHDPAVQNSPKLVFVNLLTIILVSGFAFLLSSEWFRNGAVWVLRILATPIVYLLSFLVVGVTRLFMWLMSLLPYNPNTDHQVTSATEEDMTRMPVEKEDIDVQIPPGVERVIVAVAMLLVVLIIILLFWFFMKRRKAAQTAGRGGSEERSRVDINRREKGFSDVSGVSAVRRQYQKYLKLCEKEGMEREIDDTSADVERESRKYFPGENVTELREIYMAARYDGLGGKEEARRARSLVRHLKEPVNDGTDHLEETDEEEEED